MLKLAVTVRLKGLRIKKFLFTNIYKSIRTTQKTFICNTTNTLFTLQKEIYRAYSMNVTKIAKGNRVEKRAAADVNGGSRDRLKCDGTRAETRFRLSEKRMSPFKSAEGVSSVDYWQPRCAHQR